MQNPFFKPTKMYKEYKILNMIDESSRMTQREMSHALNIAVSMVNQYLDDFEEEGLIKRIHQTRKTVDYKITPKGLKRKNVLNIWYLMSTQKLYDISKDYVLDYFHKMTKKSIETVYFYGAGEVADIFLNTYQHTTLKDSIKIYGVIDDDLDKVGKTLHQIPIISLEKASLNEVDAIFISSFTHQETLIKHIKSKNIPHLKIETFF